MGLNMICILALVPVLSIAGIDGQGLKGVLSPILKPASTTMRPNLITALQCAPPPLNAVLGFDPCACDCRKEHNATSGACNKNGVCICQYPEDGNAPFPTLPVVTLQCEFIAQQCYSNVNTQARAAFEIACNIDCMCTHGAPAGGTCNFEKQFCKCDYNGTDRAEANNAFCPAGVRDQVTTLLKGFTEQAVACTSQTLYQPTVNHTSCTTLFKYPVLLPALDGTSCLSSMNGILGLQDVLPATLKSLIPKITV